MMWPPWPLRLGLHLCEPGQAVVPLGLVTTRRQAIAIVGSYQHKTSQTNNTLQCIQMTMTSCRLSKRKTLCEFSLGGFREPAIIMSMGDSTVTSSPNPKLMELWQQGQYKTEMAVRHNQTVPCSSHEHSYGLWMLISVMPVMCFFVASISGFDSSPYHNLIATTMVWSAVQYSIFYVLLVYPITCHVLYHIIQLHHWYFQCKITYKLI